MEHPYGRAERQARGSARHRGTLSSPQRFRSLLAMLSVLDNPHRLRMIAALTSGGRNYVSQLAREIGISRPLLFPLILTHGYPDSFYRFLESRFSKDELLTQVMIYWASESIGTSFLPYYDYANAGALTG